MRGTDPIKSKWVCLKINIEIYVCNFLIVILLLIILMRFR